MPYEIEFLQVGDSNGDAICIRYGTSETDRHIHVVDGGFTDTGDKLVAFIRNRYGAAAQIEHVVLSHADQDHAAGLIKVLENFQVGTLWMNRPWLYVAEILPNFHGSYTVEGLRKVIRDKYQYVAALEVEALKKGIPIQEAFQGAYFGCFTILAPSRERYLRLIPDFDKTPTSYAEGQTSLLGAIYATAKKAVQRYMETWDIETLSSQPEPTTASNESSIVQIGYMDGEYALLTADAGPEALIEAWTYAVSRNWQGPLKVFQVPHHGSRRNVTPLALDCWLGHKVANSAISRGFAFCSLGREKNEYPRLRVSNACLRRGFPVYTTKTGNVRHNTGIARNNYVAAVPIPFTSDFSE